MTKNSGPAKKIQQEKNISCYKSIGDEGEGSYASALFWEADDD
jgi:hypothetical protein